jgi:hypothetical protein
VGGCTVKSYLDCERLAWQALPWGKRVGYEYETRQGRKTVCVFEMEARNERKENETTRRR